MCKLNNIRLTQQFPQYKASNDQEVIKKLKIDRDRALQSAIKVLRNRIDEFGVSEPIIQKFGSNRIVIELAGVQDKDRARELIKRTASMELSLVLRPERVENAISKIDSYFSSKDANKNSLLSYLEPTLYALFGELGVKKGKENEFEALLLEIESISDINLDGRFVLASKSVDGLTFPNQENDNSSITIGPYNPVYYISNKPVIIGGMVKNPVAKIAGPGSENSGQWVINLEMNREGARRLSDFTGKNIKKRVTASYDKIKDWEMDPKGYFLIDVDKKKKLLRIGYCVITKSNDNPAHEMVAEIYGKTAIEVLNTLIKEEFMSTLQHSGDMGIELCKAELALKNNLDYVQDKDLNLK